MNVEEYVRMHILDENGNRTGENYLQKSRYHVAEPDTEVEEIISESDLTLDEVIELMCERAEEENYHSLSGVYEFLAVTITELANEEKAKQVLLAIDSRWRGFMV